MSDELFFWQEEQIASETEQATRVPEPIDLNNVDPVLLDRLQLCLLPGLGPRNLSVLLNAFGSATDVLKASSEMLQRVPGIGPKLVHTIQHARDHVDVESVLRWCLANRVEILEPDRPGYPLGSAFPEPLLELDDTPPLLFASGRWQRADEFSVAIVGTRHATPYGLQQTRRLVRDLASASVTIVSGLARGIDTAAHRAALEVGGRTVAFLGGGLGSMYPPENQKLADEIRDSGVVISEASPFAKPKPGMFPQRNRLIAMASLATLVIEAPTRSGSLITARLASEMGRGVGALPGPINSRASSGCHELIRDGGTLITNADDVLELLGPISHPIQTTSGSTTEAPLKESPLNHADREIRHGMEATLSDLQRSVLDRISPTGTSIEEVISETQLPPAKVSSIVSMLEMKRLVRRLSSQFVSRV